LGLNDRQIQAVAYLRTHGRLTNRDYQEQFGVSERTALYDLQGLVDAGLALPVSSGRGRYYLLPGLGKMKGPVLFYILVICFMVNRAVSTFFGTAFTTTQAWLLTLGAMLFWLSDLVLAINRFRHPFEANRLGLFLYYGGQLLIALSPSYFA
jgi:uncharacterized membrane protein YhhN